MPLLCYPWQGLYFFHAIGGLHFYLNLKDAFKDHRGGRPMLPKEHMIMLQF